MRRGVKNNRGALTYRSIPMQILILLTCPPFCKVPSPLRQLKGPHDEKITPKHFTCTFNSYMGRVPCFKSYKLYAHIFTITPQCFANKLLAICLPRFPTLLWPQRTTKCWNHNPKLDIFHNHNIAVMITSNVMYAWALALVHMGQNSM